MSIFKKLFSGSSSAQPAEEIKNPTCPSCSFKFIKEIKSKSTCPNCKEVIFPRIHYKTKERVYLTSSDVGKFETDKKQYFFKKKWVNQLELEGISKEQIKKVHEELRQKWGPGHPSFSDLVWALFNKQVVIISEKEMDFNRLSTLYRTWSYFAGEIDTDPYNLKKAAFRYSLMNYKNSPVVTGVEVYSKDCCTECKKDHGKKQGIDEALGENGILPHKNCTYKLFETNKHTWCKCAYLPTTD